MIIHTPDLMAGERARMLQEHPERSLPVADVTDPRWGSLTRMMPADSGPVDPTDPRCGEETQAGA